MMFEHTFKSRLWPYQQFACFFQTPFLSSAQPDNFPSPEMKRGVNGLDLVGHQRKRTFTFGNCPNHEGGGRAGVYPWPIFVGPFYPELVSKIGVGDLANAQK